MGSGGSTKYQPEPPKKLVSSTVVRVAANHWKQLNESRGLVDGEPPSPSKPRRRRRPSKTSPGTSGIGEKDARRSPTISFSGDDDGNESDEDDRRMASKASYASNESLASKASRAGIESFNEKNESLASKASRASIESFNERTGTGLPSFPHPSRASSLETRRDIRRKRSKSHSVESSLNDASDLVSGERSFTRKASFRASRDTEWHEKNCTDAHLSLVTTIAEAYPFDEKQRKIVEIKERVYGGGLRDPTRQDWGKIEIAQLGPPNLSCDPCGAFILNRDMETPFYVCTNCRKHHRKLEMCVACYAAGVMATGPRKCEVHSAREAKRDGSFRDSGRPVQPIWRKEPEEFEAVKVVASLSARQTRKPLKL